MQQERRSSSRTLFQKKSFHSNFEIMRRKSDCDKSERSIRTTIKISHMLASDTHSCPSWDLLVQPTWPVESDLQEQQRIIRD